MTWQIVIQTALAVFAGVGGSVLMAMVWDEWWVLRAYWRVQRGQATLASLAPASAYKAGVDHDGPVHVVFLIAAHNEAACIAGAVRSIFHTLTHTTTHAVSPQVWVIADRCTDATAQHAREAGAQVWVRDARARDGRVRPVGKGHAINEWLTLQAASRETLDVILILDADVRCAANYLSEMLTVWSRGYPVVQGAAMTRNAEDSTVSAMNLWANRAQHIVQQGRMALQWPSLIIGNTLLIDRAVWVMSAWRCAWFSPTEEEIKAPIIAHDIPVAYAAQAWVYEEAVSDLESLSGQRSRWFRDYVAFWFRYGIVLMLHAVWRRQWKKAEAVLAHFWMTSHTLELMAVGGLSVLAVLSSSPLAIGLMAMVLLLKIGHVAALAWAAGAGWSELRMLCQRLPHLAMGWLWGMARFALRPGRKGWRHTRHKG